MSYEKPKGLLRDIQQKRITPKSRWLRKIEEQQARAAEAAQQIEAEKVEKVRQLRRETR